MSLKHIFIHFFLCLSIAYGVAFGDQYEIASKAYNEKDYKTAFQVWKELAEEGGARAQYSLGEFYQKGVGAAFGVHHDFEASVSFPVKPTVDNQSFRRL